MVSTRQGRRFYLIVAAVLVIALSACAPKATPAPAPGTSGASTGANAVSGSGDAAWQKVVQAAQKEGKLSVYSFNLTGDTGTAVAQAFKKAYGIDMEVLAGPTTQLVERLSSERRGGQHLVDVMDGAGGTIIQMKQDGATVKWGDLPAAQEKGVWMFGPLLDTDGHAYDWIPSFMLPYYNTNMVKAAEAPKSWKDFLDPKWSGKIAVSDPDTVPMLARLYTVLMRNKVLDQSYFTGLSKQNLKFYPGSRDDISAVARGEMVLDLSSAQMVANSLIKQGAPIMPFDISEGIVASASTVIFIKDAPHPNAAQVYMNWLLSKEGQAVVHQAIGGTPLRKDVPDFTPPQAAVKFAKVYSENEADVLEGARLQKERGLSKMLGK